MEVPEVDQDLSDDAGGEDELPSHQKDGYNLCELYQGGDVEEVEVDMYDNDYYSWTIDNDVLAAMMEMPVDKIHLGGKDVKMRKAVMTVSPKRVIHALHSPQI